MLFGSNDSAKRGNHGILVGLVERPGAYKIVGFINDQLFRPLIPTTFGGHSFQNFFDFFLCLSQTAAARLKKFLRIFKHKGVVRKGDFDLGT